MFKLKELFGNKNNYSTKKVRKKLILEKGILYLDFTASGLAYKPIEKEIQKVLKTYANTHSEVGYFAEKTSKSYEKARKSLHKTLKVGKEFSVLPIGTGATGAIKKFQELLGLYIPPVTRNRYKIEKSELPLVIIGPFEHHSNEVSFREALCETIVCPLNKKGEINLEKLEEILEKNSKREIIGSFSAASNVTGIKNPIEQISKLIRKYNGIMCVDAAASSPYMNVKSDFYDAMFLSPHKLIGGPGSCGLLVIRKKICNKSDKPTFAGGGTVSYVSKNIQTYSNDIELREDVGTPGILQFIRASLAYELRNNIGLDLIHKKEEKIKKYFYNKIKNIDGIKLYCNSKHDKIAIFSFNIEGFSPYFLAKELSDKYKIQTRAGCSCAGPYGHELLGLAEGVDISTKPGWLRIGWHYLYEEKDIDYFIESLEEIISKKK